MNDTLSTEPTIAAIATGASPSELGVIRVSGADALSLVQSLWLPDDTTEPAGATGNNEKGDELAHSRRQLCGRFTVDGVVSYPAFAYVMPGPNSYTGEHVIEIHGPGNPVILDDMLHALFRAGVQAAGPGEFTKRAYLNGRMDLVQARSVMQLIQASSERERLHSLAMLEGCTSDTLTESAGRLVEVIGLIQASLEFNPDEIGVIEADEYVAKLHELIQLINSVKPDESHARAHQFARVVITGYANVGKSSLFNALIGEHRAFVSEQPHSTRDVMEMLIHQEGDTCCLCDTPGVELEQGDFSVGMAQRYGDTIANADVAVFVFDGLRDVDQEELNAAAAIDKPCIYVVNKADEGGVDVSVWRERVGPEIAVVAVSAQSGEGIEALREQIQQAVQPMSVMALGPQFAQVHQEIIQKLSQALSILEHGDPEEFAVTYLQEAQFQMDELRGADGNEDALDGVFKRFCVGK